MMILKKASVVHALATALLASGALLAPAQQGDPRKDPETTRIGRERAISGVAALELVAKARRAMRQGHYDEAFLLADRGREAMQGLGGIEYTAEAREVLSENALLRGRPLEALRDIDALPDHLVVQRIAMTRALALVALKRSDEAKAMVLRLMGTSDKPTYFRDAKQLWRLPLDVDASDRALMATIYVIRADWWHGLTDRPEVVEDIRAALRLEPNDPILHFQLGRELADGAGTVEEAQAELAKAEASGDKLVRLAMGPARLTLEFRKAHPERFAHPAGTPPSSP